MRECSDLKLYLVNGQSYALVSGPFIINISTIKYKTWCQKSSSPPLR